MIQNLTLELLEKLRAVGVKRARFDVCNLVEVEFFADGPQPASETATPGEQADYERELDERTAGYDQALAQIARRSFKQGAS